MSRFIVHIDGDLTHQQVCALVVHVGKALGNDATTIGTSEARPFVPHRWEYQQANANHVGIDAAMDRAARDMAIETGREIMEYTERELSDHQMQGASS